MAGPTTSKMHSPLFMTDAQEEELVARFTKEKTRELVFAVEMVSYVMKESNQQFEEFVYPNSKGTDCHSPFDDVIRKLVRITVAQLRSQMIMKVEQYCNMKNPSYEEFRKYAFDVALNAELILNINALEFFYASVMLAQICTFAFMNGLSKAPNLGIMLICRIHSNLFFDIHPLYPQLWYDLTAEAMIATLVLEGNKVDIKSKSENPSGLFMIQEQENELICRFTKEKTEELVFAVEMMSFVMKESGLKKENFMYPNSSKKPCPSPFNEEMQKLVKFTVTQYRSRVVMMVKKNCNMSQPCYAEFRNYANFSALQAEKRILNSSIYAFFFTSVMLAHMCTFALVNGLSKAPNLGIMLICRTYHNVCLNLYGYFWDDLKEEARKAILVLEAVSENEKDSGNNPSGLDEKERQVQEPATIARSMQPEQSTSSGFSMIHKRKRTTSQDESVESSRKHRLPNTYKCRHCDYYCTEEHELNDHMRVHTTLTSEDGLISSSTLAYCVNCNAQFESSIAYEIHKASQCGRRLSHRHIGQISTPNPGQQQPQSQKPIIPLIRRLLTTQLVASQLVPIARYCADCDTQFSSLNDYQVHKILNCCAKPFQKSTGQISSPNPIPQQPQTHQQPTDLSIQKLLSILSVTPPLLRYCFDCHKQFTLFKTYQAHKEYYCKARKSSGKLFSSNPKQQ